jgi:hypothetical protein
MYRVISLRPLRFLPPPPAVDLTTRVITAFAGGGSGIDGVSYLGASLFTAWYTAVMPGDGSILIATAGNRRVLRLTPGGVVRHLAGNGTAAFGGDGMNALAASMNTPIGVAAMDVGGGVTEVFISEANRVRAVRWSSACEAAYVTPTGSNSATRSGTATNSATSTGTATNSATSSGTATNSATSSAT